MSMNLQDVERLEEKISLFLAQGVQVGILIDPDKKVVSIYRNTGITSDDGEAAILQKTTLQDNDILTIPEFSLVGRLRLPGSGLLSTSRST